LITLSSEKGLFQIENWDDIVSRPGFVRNLDPKTHKLKAIIGRYVFPEEIRCGLSNCHTPHARGYIVVTEDGHETNIGKDCGKTYFGVDFEVLSRKFDSDLAASENRQKLASFSFHQDAIEGRIKELRGGPQGADWIHRKACLLVKANGDCPDEVLQKLNRMIKARTNELTSDRRATDSEVELIEAQRDRTVQKPYYISEFVTHIAGIEALYPDNDLRDILILNVAERLQSFREISIAELSQAELREWKKWTDSVESRLEQATAIVTAGRQLLTFANLEPFVTLVSGETNRNRFRTFLRRLTAP
jgi:hypothetical protein